ncbi:NAD(P)H-quinone oxidoreductase [Corynebacterium crudilactis]|uniref:NAD(P)H-quinone oxidoreductase n=1 Tax=Corynebacterium crudilactis TaxID=1652495 RepID=A0A172QX63_9CORY|nr:NAD(P)H-quinone oxidoreductase [Corynebacterium crudilactis]ANE05220.1 NAD(P)H-quinone oxidoreductase [Corynebacterium crudilactis]
MKAIVQTEEKVTASLQLQEVPTPTLKPGEVLVQVKAAGINRADLLQTQGNYPVPAGASEILGLECAGVIVEAGDTENEVGQEVACLLTGGGYAEYVAVPQGQLMPIPQGYSFVEAASIVEVACTVWSNIGMLAGLREGQTFLIHGGAGGIGTFAIQMGKALGATVAVTAGSAEKLATCKELGADILINYKEEDFADVLKNKADVILDIIGAKYLTQNVKAMAKDGHMVTIGMQGGVKGELNLGHLLAKRGTISATALRGRDNADKARIVRSTIENMWPLLDSKKISHHIDHTLPLAKAADALQKIQDGTITGKLVLEI